MLYRIFRSAYGRGLNSSCNTDSHKMVNFTRLWRLLPVLGLSTRVGSGRRGSAHSPCTAYPPQDPRAPINAVVYYSSIGFLPPLPLPCSPRSLAAAGPAPSIVPPLRLSRAAVARPSPRVCWVRRPKVSAPRPPLPPRGVPLRIPARPGPSSASAPPRSVF